MLFKKSLLSFASAIMLCFSMASHATISGSNGDARPNQFDNSSYIYTKTGSGGKRDIKKTRISYNKNTQDFQLNYSLKKNADIDFMWSVISTGDVKGSQNHAIMYTDLKNKVISVYRYDTALGVNSFKAGDLLGTFQEDGTNMIRDSYFTINVGDINSAFGGDWEGVQMAEKGGIWFHTARDANVKYDADGNIINLNLAGESWVDQANFKTKYRGDEPVSAPFGLLAIAGAFLLARRRQK